MMLRGLCAAACLALLPFTVLAAEPEAKTLLTERGKQLFADSLNQPLGKDWATAKGKWEIVDGALKGSELKSDMHGAVTRHAMRFHDAVLQYSFKLDGCKSTTLSINDAKGHCCRLLITPSSFAVQKDSHDHNMNDKAAVLERSTTKVDPGEWHTVVVEILGDEMLATLDGKTTVFGANPSINVEKTNFGLTVAGESAEFKDLRVWEATPNKDWATTKQKLLEGKPKATKAAK